VDAVGVVGIVAIVGGPVLAILDLLSGSAVGYQFWLAIVTAGLILCGTALVVEDREGWT